MRPKTLAIASFAVASLFFAATKEPWEASKCAAEAEASREARRTFGKERFDRIRIVLSSRTHEPAHDVDADHDGTSSLSMIV